MRYSFLFVLLGVVSLASVVRSAETRTWTDRDGRKTEAEFVAFADGKVQIKRASDNKIFQVPLDRLSAADQLYVKSQILETPLGAYAGVVPITAKKVKSRVVAGFTSEAGKLVPNYKEGETTAGANEVLVWVHFHTPKALSKDVHFDMFSVVINEKPSPVLASTPDLNAEFVEVIRKATTQHGADQNTYLLFAIPNDTKKFRLAYADAGIDLALPNAAVSAANEKAKAKKQTFVEGLDYFIWSLEEERVQSREGLLRMLISLEYELNPEKAEAPFSIVMSFTVKDSVTGMLYEHQGISTPEKPKDLTSGRTAAVLLGAASLKGEGDAVIYLTKAPDTKKPISNKVKVPVLFEK